ncbi:hypothetical protein BFJ66_g4044 [Fusarium oxysporum f. sp. cepae]|uniref:Uncharacterized protein n=1 Tax=Fusarium oxysporum f. sp. cepae TaxID=396571 RepID=A0A3L6N8G3_FUSOX|nr:hypothetical protein BFJ65_g12224 [Fusarium oxysporum f. sp. cepae]RKK47979.1 hypothetical protein BFJ67_g7528 [Fusarium oxysporum f. sp. cepae]RKK55730.1 hypothetical protein BFJ66_g4044 [Fusarium oxysporum f. sp. cepae]
MPSKLTNPECPAETTNESIQPPPRQDNEANTDPDNATTAGHPCMTVAEKAERQEQDLAGIGSRFDNDEINDRE